MMCGWLSTHKCIIFYINVFMMYSEINTHIEEYKMLSLNQIKERLSDRAIILKVVSDKTGVPYATVIRIANNTIASPKYKDVVKLSEYFESKEA